MFILYMPIKGSRTEEIKTVTSANYLFLLADFFFDSKIHLRTETTELFSTVHTVC